MGQTIQPVSRNESVPFTQPQVQASCLPTCVTEALQSVGSLFSRIGMANLIGAGAIVLAASFFGAVTALVTSLLFLGFKALELRAEPNVAEQIIAPQPLPPVQNPMRLEVLPPGTVRSQFSQDNVWRHRYDINNLDLGYPELQDALVQPIPHEHDQTCCAITATLINFFYLHGFTHLAPIQLDALLAKGIKVDDAIRAQNPRLGRREIDIFELNEGLELGQLPAFVFDPDVLPIQKILIPNNPQANIASFRDLLEEFFARAGAVGPFAGSLLRPNHFAGLYIDRNDQGEILQIYVSESSSSFLEHVQYDSGDNRQGAMVVPIGNTIEAAAEKLARFYSDANMVTLYLPYEPVPLV